MSEQARAPKFELTAPAQRAAKPLPRSRLKMSHLRMIVALEEHEMVSAAADAMSISQPAASRMIAEMETLLNAQLCERLSRGVRLTPLGQSLARHARSVLLQLAQAEQEITDIRTGRSGSVAIGAVTAPAIDLAAPAIGKIRSIFPRIELDIKIDTSNVLARELLASRLDFVVARIPDDLDPALFDCLTIGVEEACLIARSGHPLLAQSPVGLEPLKAYDWVMQPRGTPLRRTIENLFLAKNLSPPERLSNTSSLLLTMILVAKSDAIAPMSVEAARFAAPLKGASGAIEILPTSFEIVVQAYSLIRVRNRAMSPAAQSVYDFVRNEAIARGASKPLVGRRAAQP
jgi:DNA-binding transcriptional LysR family regulator